MNGLDSSFFILCIFKIFESISINSTSAPFSTEIGSTAVIYRCHENHCLYSRRSISCSSLPGTYGQQRSPAQQLWKHVQFSIIVVLRVMATPKEINCSGCASSGPMSQEHSIFIYIVVRSDKLYSARVNIAESHEHLVLKSNQKIEFISIFFSSSRTYLTLYSKEQYYLIEYASLETRSI